MARSRTMCHNYAQGVNVKTALKPKEVVFISINILTEHHIGVSSAIPLSARLPPLPSLVAMLSLSVTSCVYLWVCANMVNVCSVCPISSSCFRYCEEEEEEEGWGAAMDPVLERRSVFYLSKREKHQNQKWRRKQKKRREAEGKFLGELWVNMYFMYEHTYIGFWFSLDFSLNRSQYRPHMSNPNLFGSLFKFSYAGVRPHNISPTWKM